VYSTPQPTRRPPLPPRHRHARGLAWLAGAISALAVLAAAAAAVSWDAQYVLVARALHAPVIAALEAGIPDAGAAVFAALGIALALHGHRALRPRDRRPGKQDRLIALAGQRHDLYALPVGQVAAIATATSAEVRLHPGTARRVLRAHVLALQNHHAASRS